MPIAETEIRSALLALQASIAGFEARLHEAAASHAAGDPSLQPLRDSLQLLRMEQQRLREQLLQISP